MTNKGLQVGIFDEQKYTHILVKNNVITAQEAEAFHKAFENYDGDEFIDFLIDEDLIPESELLDALAEYYQVPAVDVLGYLFYHDLLVMFPKEFLIAHEIIPLTVDENIMIIIAANPSDPDLASKIEKYVSYEIQFYVGFARDICDEVEEFYDKSDADIDEDCDSRIGFSGPIGPDGLSEDEFGEDELIIELYDPDDEDAWGEVADDED